MTDADLVAAIRKIITARVRLKPGDKGSYEAADLARYDQIRGLVQRHAAPREKAAASPAKLERSTPLLRVAEKASPPADPPTGAAS